VAVHPDRCFGQHCPYPALSLNDAHGQAAGSLSSAPKSAATRRASESSE
jgi:hypothetical protein